MSKLNRDFPFKLSLGTASWIALKRGINQQVADFVIGALCATKMNVLK